MLITLGAKERPENLVELLLECHTRIRHFSEVAVKLGTLSELNSEEVVEGCVRCLRYFREALPLHVKDEEESLLPRLLCAEPDLKKSLETMKEQHQDHEPVIHALIEALERVQASPLDQPRRAHLGKSAQRFSTEIEEHLSLEESNIFPSVDQRLNQGEQDAILAELRARRADSFREP